MSLSQRRSRADTDKLTPGELTQLRGVTGSANSFANKTRPDLCVSTSPVQRAVITNECPWCRSVFSTRLDAQHHACSSFLHGSCRMGGSNVHTVIRQPQLPVECPLCKKDC